MSTLFPSTPTPQRVYKWPQYDPSHKPMMSSPLASPSSPTLSPISARQNRRREQYKSRAPSTPRSSGATGAVKSSTFSGGSVFSGGQQSSPASEDPTRSLMRERFRARCVQKAVRARELAVKKRRYDYSPGSHAHTSDDTAMDDDDEEDDEAIMEDELFRRIMNHANRKSVHAYRLSYAEDVGSSFDPDMEDVEAWERELLDAEENIPDDMTDEEIAAYAEEQAALADLQGLDIEAFLDMEPFEGMDIDTSS